MGFTPLEGLMMDTRSGSIDPGIILHLLTKKKSSVKEISDQLFDESGLLGISGISSDMRDIIEKSAQGNLSSYACPRYLHPSPQFSDRFDDRLLKGDRSSCFYCGHRRERPSDQEDCERPFLF